MPLSGPLGCLQSAPMRYAHHSQLWGFVRHLVPLPWVHGGHSQQGGSGHLEKTLNAIRRPDARL